MLYEYMYDAIQQRAYKTLLVQGMHLNDQNTRMAEAELMEVPTANVLKQMPFDIFSQQSIWLSTLIFKNPCSL